MRMRSTVCGVAALAAAAWVSVSAGVDAATAQQGGEASGQGRAVEIALGIEAGDVMRYTVSTELEIEQRGAAPRGGEGAAPEQAALPTQELSYDADLRFTVAEVSDDGSAQIRVTAERYEASWSVGGDGGSVSADLEAMRREMEAGGMAEAPPSDRAMAALARAVGVIELDAEGAVTGVRGFAGFERAVRSMSGVDDRAIGFLTNEQMLGLVRPIFTADGAAGGSWSPGEGWQTTRMVELSNAGVLDYTYAWTLASADGGVAVIEGTADIGLRVPTTPDPMRPDLTLGEASETVRTRWDLDAGQLLGRRSEQSNTIVFELAGEVRSARLEQTTRGTTTIERTE